MNQLSKRIKSIINYNYTKSYKYIYDLCCDHGHIGCGLHNRFPTSHFIFIDKEKHIIENLKLKLSSDIPKADFMSKSILDLKIETNSLLVLAGIGGNLIEKFLDTVDTKQADILICCNQHVHQLRYYLMSSKYKLISEDITVDNSQLYEMIYLSDNSSNNISLLNSEITNHPDKYLDFIKEQHSYFELKSKYNDEKIFRVLADEYARLN